MAIVLNRPVASRAVTQARWNIRHIYGAIQNHTVAFERLPNSSDESWRKQVHQFLLEHHSEAMPVEFRIPTSCSGSSVDSTNVYLIAGAYDRFDGLNSRNWSAFVKLHGKTPLLIVLKQVCEPWRNNGQLEVPVDIDTNDLEAKYNSPGWLVLVNGEIVEYGL